MSLFVLVFLTLLIITHLKNKNLASIFISANFLNDYAMISFRKLLYLLLAGLLSTHMGISQGRVKLLNMSEVGFLKDSGEANRNNIDNKIFVSRRVFTYKPTFRDSLGTKYCGVFYNEQCSVDKQVPCIDWKYLTTKVPDIETYPVTSFCLYVYENKLTNSLSETQTLIKYDYYHEGHRIFLGEQTGVVEDSLQVFIHPPRSYAFAITEFNPFAAFRLPLHLGKKWQSYIDFPISYMLKAKLKGMIATDPIHFDFSYEVTGQTQIDTKLGLLPCMVIRGVGTSIIGSTTSTFYYNEHYGVVDVLYENIDRSNLRIQLEAVTEP
jgi:hypothetical protein